MVLGGDRRAIIDPRYTIAYSQTQPLKLMADDCQIIISSVRFIITFHPSDWAMTEGQLTILMMPNSNAWCHTYPLEVMMTVGYL